LQAYPCSDDCQNEHDRSKNFHVGLGIRAMAGVFSSVRWDFSIEGFGAP